MRVQLSRPRLNFEQVLLVPIIMAFLIVGASGWLFALIKIDDPFLIANPGWVNGIGFFLIGVIVGGLIGMFYCFVLLLKIIVQEVGYDSIVQALEKQLKDIKKRE